MVEFADDIRGQALLSGATFEQADEIVRKELLDVVSAKSLANMTNNLEFSLDGTQSGIRVGSEFFPEGALGLSGGIDTTNGMFTETFGDIAKPLSDADFYRLAKSGTYLKALKTAGVYLGPVGDILEIAIAAVTIKSLYDAGDQEGVARESSKFAASFLAGSAGAAFAAELALPLLFGGPVGVVAYGLIVVGAGITSSVAGERTVDWLFNGGGGNFFGQDGQGLYVDVYQRGPDGRLYVTRARQRVGFDEIEIGTPGLSDQVEIVVTAQPDGSVRGTYIKLRDPVSGEAQLILSEELLGDFENAFKAFLAKGGTLVGGGGVNRPGIAGGHSV